jgi:hypothetical protein
LFQIQIKPSYIPLPTEVNAGIEDTMVQHLETGLGGHLSPLGAKFVQDKALIVAWEEKKSLFFLHPRLDNI